jgi:hypothetical protein
MTKAGKYMRDQALWGVPFAPAPHGDDGVICLLVCGQIAMEDKRTQCWSWVGWIPIQTSPGSAKGI